MSTFTIQLNELIGDGFDVGLNDYPIFDATYRPLLNRKITDHYALFEIGLETDEMFKFALNRRMREIMPYYNQLYLSEKIVFDPLSTMDFTETGVSTSESDSTGHTDTAGVAHTATTSTGDTTSDTTSDSTNTTTSSSDSRSRVVNSELPQVRLSGDEDYATSAADSVSDSNTTATSLAGITTGEVGTSADSATSDSTQSGDVDTVGSESASGTLNREMKGYQGHAAELLMRYRESLLNIDMLVIADLSNLFMGVWDNGDEYSTGRNRGYGYFYPAI